jgi:hypothetical protein
MEKPNISSQAFWDVNFEKIDFNEKANFVICRVFEYGSLSDLKAVFNYYKKTQIKNAVKKAPFLRENAVAKASFLLDLPETEFKCYNTRPSHLRF